MLEVAPVTAAPVLMSVMLLLLLLLARMRLRIRVFVEEVFDLEKGSTNSVTVMGTTWVDSLRVDQHGLARQSSQCIEYRLRQGSLGGIGQCLPRILGISPLMILFSLIK